MLHKFGVQRGQGEAPGRGMKGRPAIQAERPLFLDEATFAGMGGKEEDAPIPAVRGSDGTAEVGRARSDAD